MAAFREKHGKDLPIDYTSMCGGMADSKGKFTDSKQFEIVSFGHPKLGKIMLDTGDLVSGSGEGKFYYDLCSSGGEKGVLDQARFQVSPYPCYIPLGAVADVPSVVSSFTRSLPKSGMESARWCPLPTSRAIFFSCGTKVA